MTPVQWAERLGERLGARLIHGTSSRVYAVECSEGLQLRLIWVGDDPCSLYVWSVYASELSSDGMLAQEQKMKAALAAWRASYVGP